MNFLKTLGLLKVCGKTGRTVGVNFKSRLAWVLLPLTGVLALAWFLFRVLPKPSRATYPCMQVAAPLAGSFLGYLGSLWLSAFGLRRAGVYFKGRRYVVAMVCLGLVAGAALVNIGLSVHDSIAGKKYVAADENIDKGKPTGQFTPSEPANQPMGVAKGIVPGRVAWAWDTEATKWDGKSEFYYSAQFNDQARISAMFEKDVITVANAKDIDEAWKNIFSFFNENHGKGKVGYKKGEKIAVKVNMNNNGGSKGGNHIDISPDVVYSLLDNLVNKVGVPQANITVYDAEREGNKAIVDICGAKFPDVRYNPYPIEWVSEQIKYSVDPKGSTVTDPLSMRIPKYVVEADYLINMALLKRHTKPTDSWKDSSGQTAVTMCGKNNFGTIGKVPPLHHTIRDWAPERGMGSYNPIVDLIGSKMMGGKTLIYFIDGLYAGNIHNATPIPWKMAPFNNHYPSSIFCSLDPLAIDSVGLDFLRAEWPLAGNADNYLHEAAQVENPPSGAKYLPDGAPLKSLGVHEHWNNAKEMQYTRNLGKGAGIELVKIAPGTPAPAPVKVVASKN